jgi:hypothetical protein
MTNTGTRTYRVAVIERALAYYTVEAGDARAAAENWQDGEFYDRDDEALETDGPCNVRERQPDGNWRIVPPSEWEDAPPAAAIAEAERTAPPPATDPAKKPYSVLLLYPDYANDGGTETYYAFVVAPDPTAAVAAARQRALAAQEGVIFPPDDFAPLLVTDGHHHGLPMSND